MLLGVMLQRSNYELDTAGNGHEAVEMWENGEYDLILMDVQMPRMNGFEATAAIREKERSLGGHIPIIAMTAHALKEDEERCLNAGMDAYISKPIDFNACRRLIGETLKKWRLRLLQKSKSLFRPQGVLPSREWSQLARVLQEPRLLIKKYYTGYPLCITKIMIDLCGG